MKLYRFQIEMAASGNDPQEAFEKAVEILFNEKGKCPEDCEKGVPGDDGFREKTLDFGSVEDSNERDEYGDRNLERLV